MTQPCNLVWGLNTRAQSRRRMVCLRITLLGRCKMLLACDKLVQREHCKASNALAVHVTPQWRPSSWELRICKCSIAEARSNVIVADTSAFPCGFWANNWLAP